MTRILRKHVSASSIPQVRVVLEEAADALVLSPAFDPLRRALSRHLKPGTDMTGQEAEAILLEAYEERDPERPSTERHSQFGPVVAPWFKVWSDNSKQARLLYEGTDEVEALRIARLHPHSMKIGSIYS